jgi:STE24 endopeptidase
LRVARGTLAAVAAAGWLLAAWLLLRTAVPSGLELAPVDVDRVFGTAAVDEAERFEQFLRVVWVLSQLALLATLWFYARRGAVFARESAGGRIATGMLLGMLGFAIAWLVQLPFSLVSFWWVRRHDLYDAGFLDWAVASWGGLGAQFLFVCLALLVVMALAGPLGDRWWIPGAAAFVGLAALFMLVQPWLQTETEPVRDPRLVANAPAYASDQGIEPVPVRIEVVSGETSLANAYAFGWGPSRRVVLWDTLVDGFAPGEVDVALAHEIAHHSSEHIPKGLAWFALFAFPGAWLVARATRRAGGMRRPEAVPLALLVVVALQLALTPVTNWISREMEREADWKALETTRDPDSARGLFRGFASTSLGDPSPPAWARLFLDTHPALADRVAMADAWQARQPGRRAASD